MAEQTKKRKNHHPVSGKNLLIATLLNLVITVVEIAGGLLSNSLALLSDALHNLSDTFATFIAYVAIHVGKRNPTAKKTFGYKRVEILAAMLNAVILIIICFYLFREAWERLQDPEPIKSMIVIIVAMIGLGANLLAVALLRKDSRKSINVKAAYVHLIGDSLSSVVVVLAAAAIQLFSIYWLDPLVTFLIGIYLIREAYVILKEAVNILMQSTPENINVKKIQSKVEAFPEVSSLHHLHVWTLDENEIHLEAHVELSEDRKISETAEIQKKTEKMLMEKFHIRHITLQFEYDPDHAQNLIANGKEK
ncbi:MAG: cation diffusion facilitator family transporter [Bacteroidales bacterium]|nr:cation diffusion facilitator family transporter [Bacteroidales bacterium]MDT8431192.1 cation diffusion facilitator family transporter [Bacteroidales bacterium]